MRLHPVAALLALALGACNGTTAASGRCTTDADCPANALCKSDGNCGCKNDNACAEGQFCNAQSVCQARAGCRDNRDCQSTELCDLGTGECLARTACGASTHCDLGSVCDAEQGRCAIGCYDDGDCPLYQVCERTGTAQDPLGRCVAGKCGDRTFCELGQVCQNQTCADNTGSVNCTPCDPAMVDSCGRGNYCLINPRYDPADPNSGSANYCGAECQTAEDCGNGYSCTRIVLVSGAQALCRDNTECQNPRICQKSAENDPRGFCTCANDADCALDVIRFCQGSCGGFGVRACQQDSDCQASRCVKRCLGNNAMCTDDTDCPAQSLCSNSGLGNVCLNTGMPCNTGADCLCANGRCFGSGRSCTSSAQCQLSCQAGGCVLGSGCGPIEGLTCDDLR